MSPDENIEIVRRVYAVLDKAAGEAAVFKLLEADLPIPTASSTSDPPIPTGPSCALPP